MQCARDTDPEKALEEQPGDALYKLAEQFREQGKVEARVATLRYIVEHYPSSRFAETARLELNDIDKAAPDSHAP